MSTIKCRWVIFKGLRHICWRSLARQQTCMSSHICSGSIGNLLLLFQLRCPRENRLTFVASFCSLPYECVVNFEECVLYHAVHTHGGAQHALSQTTFFLCVAMFPVNKQPNHLHSDSLSTALPYKLKSELFLCKSMEKSHFHFSQKEVGSPFICAKGKKRKDSIESIHRFARK